MNKGIEKAKAEGGKCLRCGDDEFRIDGYCTLYCRDIHEVERERDAVLKWAKDIEIDGIDVNDPELLVRADCAREVIDLIKSQV